MTRFNFVSRRAAAWGISAIGLVFVGVLFWEGLWEHAERIRNLALVAAAAFGLPIAAWRSYTAYRQAETAHRQAETAQNSLLDERYQRAAEMLGGKLAVRLAGIHALSRMAQNHLTHHVLIMSALSAVVRTSAKRQLPEDKKQEPEDATVIIEVLAARSPEQLSMESKEGYQLDLRGTDLRGQLTYRIEFSRAILDYAIFSDSEYPAVFLDTDFQDASLISVQLDAAFFTGADFSSANLGFANLTNTNLSLVNFHGATLARANFSGAQFKDAYLGDALLAYTDLTNVTGLTQQQLNSAKIDPSHPPILTGATDPDTGRPLVVPS